ncbi:MAG: hypothetical protein J1F36_02100 [Clostridiales bacterium]|nr:hypothetical protein [Clostridiales bacterium]
MLALLYKDFKLIFASGKAGKWRIVSYIINVLIIAMFIIIETLIVSGLLKKLSSYVNAPLALLSIALFIVSVLMIFVCLTQAKKLFFNDKDVSNLSTLPIKNAHIIMSKLLFLFLMQYVMGLMFTYPIIASYASIFNRGKMLYYFGLFYPLLAFPFECGVALIFMYPYKLLSDFLKKHPLLQFIVAVIIVFLLCWLYSRVLNLFVNVVAGGNFDAILNADTIGKMINARRFMIPVTWLVSIFFESGTSYILVHLCVALGVLIFGIVLCVVSFNYLRNIRFGFSTKEKKFTFKTMSTKKALIKKEFTLLFKDSDNLFSFTGLLVVQPFLVYLIVSSINTVFNTGVFKYYVSILTSFPPIIDILLIILASLIISQGANSYISNEGKNIRLIKTMPVNVFTQLFIKVAMPLVFVLVSVLVTYITLLAFGTISVTTAIFGFILTVLIQVIYSVISLYEELKIRHNSARSYFLSSTFSYMLPILYSAAMIIASYFGLSIYIAYIIGFVIIVASGLPWVIRFKQRTLDLFDKLEVVN